MRVVVADTGPLHYLVLIGQVDLLPSLFVGVIVPAIVQSELQHPMAPPLVRAWAAKAPPWLKVSPVLPRDDPALHRLDDGENAAITLALTAKADLLLMDDRVGVAVARATGVPVIGTLGILDLAARRRLVDIAAAIAQLKATNFRVRPSLLDELLTRYKNTGEHGIT